MKMEQHCQQALTNGTDEIPNDPGFVIFNFHAISFSSPISLLRADFLSCRRHLHIGQEFRFQNGSLFTFDLGFFFRKMFIGGLSWQTTAGKLFCLYIFLFLNCHLSPC